MDRPLFFPIILGTTREGRESEKVARFLLGEARKQEGMETQLFDVRDFPIPKEDYGEAIKDQYPEWRDAVVRSDGVIIVSPEYNHGYPGTLKFVLDLLLSEYNRKAAGLVGVSAGPWGGARMIEQLALVCREFGLVPAAAMQVPTVQDMFDDQGVPKDQAYYERASRFLDNMEWMGKTLRWGRENLS